MWSWMDGARAARSQSVLGSVYPQNVLLQLWAQRAARHNSQPHTPFFTITGNKSGTLCQIKRTGQGHSTRLRGHSTRLRDGSGPSYQIKGQVRVILPD